MLTALCFQQVQPPATLTHLVDLKIWIGRDDGTSREIDSLSGKVASESTLLAFETLAEPSDWFLSL